VGIRVSQAHAQSVEKKNPDLGDARDHQHLAMAAAIGGVFVTHDKALARTAKNIPALTMEVLTAFELVGRLRA
jgi:predicted nucleic acid-binding protein